MKVGVLTSSRADFGIYLPLLKGLKKDNFFSIELIAFGTHLSKNHGYTINEIKNNGFDVNYKIETPTENDSPEGISRAVGETISRFSSFWKKSDYDLIFALGDRYEMFAAVVATAPFNLAIAHLHAGETTLGAIDNMYRHSISLFSKYLFVSTETYKKRAIEVIGKSSNVFNVGALSIDNLKSLKLLTTDEFKEQFDIDLTLPTVLSTFHPETVDYAKNEEYITELIAAFEILSQRYQLVITMPNTDTTGNMIRTHILAFGNNKQNVHIVESFGALGYLSCMKHCSFMIGNTSSGFVEASFFPKYVVNLGNRQRGRIVTDNILSITIKSEEILKCVKKIEQSEPLKIIKNIYGSGNAAKKIIERLKSLKIGQQ